VVCGGAGKVSLADCARTALRVTAADEPCMAGLPAMRGSSALGRRRPYLKLRTSTHVIRTFILGSKKFTS
jgi:hypothetical protein